MELFLYEEVMLLALRNDKGTVTLSFSEYSVAGAILVELLLTERIRIADNSKALVDVVSRKPVGDPILDEALQMIATAKRRASLKNWLSRIGRIKKLGQRVAQKLAERGILRATEDKILLFFTRKLFPEINPKPEREIIQRLEAAIYGNSSQVSIRTTLLISLTYGSDLLHRNLDRKKVKAHKKRIETIIEGEAIGKATREVIQSVQAAVMVAVLVPVIVS